MMHLPCKGKTLKAQDANKMCKMTIPFHSGFEREDGERNVP